MNDVLRDRRLSDRPQPPKLKIQINKRIDSIINNLTHCRLGILIMTFIVLINIWVIWWSLENRMSIVNTNNEKVMQLSVLENNIRQLKNGWSSQQLHNITVASAELEPFIFPDYRKIAEWLTLETQQAKSHGLKMTYTFGEASILIKPNQVVSVPIRFEVEIIDNNTVENGYHILLNQLKAMDSVSWQHELLSASMESKGAGARKLKMQLNVLVRTAEDYKNDVLEPDSLTNTERGMI